MHNPLNDPNIQFDMYLNDIQNLWDQIYDNKSNHEMTNNSHFINYKDFYDSMFFKMEELHITLIDIEKSIHNLSFEYYLTYFGPYREPNSEGQLFYDATLRGREAKRRIGFLFDAFLSQYISLLDLVIKNCWKIAREHNQSRPEIKSLGHILKLLRNNNIDRTLQMVQDLLIYENEFNEIKNYRNYIIHSGALSMFDGTERNNFGHNNVKLEIPEITWRPGNIYELNSERRVFLSFFIRDRYKILLKFIKKYIDINYLTTN